VRSHFKLEYGYPRHPRGELQNGAEVVHAALSQDVVAPKWEWFLDQTVWQIFWPLPNKSTCSWIETSAVITDDTICLNAPRSIIARLTNNFAHSLKLPFEPVQYSVTDLAPSPLIAISELQSRTSPQFIYLREAVVFYGGWLSGVNDTIKTPLYMAPDGGSIPAVMQHMIAYDNLISLNRNMRSPLRDVWMVQLTFSFLVLSAIAVIFILIRRLIARFIPTISIAAGAAIMFGWVGWAIVTSLYFPVIPSEWITLPIEFGAGITLADRLILFLEKRTFAA